MGTGSFTYTISDGGRTDTATVTVEVPNTAPVARDDVATVAPVGSTDVAVLANDADAQSPRADLTVALIAAPAHGSALVVNGEVRYTPTAGYKGADSLQYQVCDPSGLCDTATLTITVANAAPVAVDDSRTTTLNQPVVVSVLTNDSDPNPGDVLRLTRIVTRPANGVATFDAAAGTITYTPATGFVGDDALVYEVCDNDTPPACSTATLRVATANQPPVASDDVAVSQHRAGQPTVVSINVMANDSDPDGEPLALVGLTQPSVGTASIVDGRVVYTAPDGFVGTESFTYEVSDGSGGTARAVVSVTVLNRAPDVVADSASTTTNSPVAIAVLANDSDPDRDGLTVAILTQPASGTVTAQADGTLLYTPATGASGQFSFTYRACDPHAGCADAVVSVQVVDGAPNARDDVATVLPGGTVNITVLANDTEPDGQPLSDPVIVTGPTTGTATVIAGGAIRYVADSPAPAGTVVTFTYRTCDNSATPLCDEAVVRVTIDDAAPVTAADGATTTRSTPVTLNVVGNDTDANGDALRVGSVSQPSSGGTVRLMPDGTVRFTPDGSVVGPVVFTYTACDPGGQCTTGTVTVTVTNAAPVAVNDLDSVQPGGSVTIPALANDRDPDAGDVVSFVSNTTPTVGTVTWQPATGTFLVQAPTGYVGPITFDYTITDGRLTDTATVTVQVTDVPPLAEDDAATTSRNRTVDIDVRGNDGEPNGQALSLPEVQLTPAHGTVVVLADGTLRYTPDGTFVGEVTFTYQVCDTGAPRQCDTATVFMAVTNARPVARDDFAAVNPGERVDVVVLRNDGDPDPGDVVTVARIVAAPAQGTAVLQPDGRITYTAPTGFAGSVTFTYEVTDGLTMSTASVTVVVGDVAPVAVDDAVTTAEDTDLLVSPLINDTEPNGQALRITAVTQPVAGGTVEVVPGGQVRFRPTPGTSGVVTFGYTACDPSDLCSTATVTVTVGAVNDPPVFTADATNTTQSLAFGGTPLAMRATDVDSSSLTYRILSGSLPPGVGLLPDGTFTGSATQAGSTTARVEVCDSAGGCTVSTLVIAISAQVVPVLPATPAPPEAGTTVTSVVAPIAATPATAAPTVLPTTIAVPPSQSPTTIATPTTAAPVEPSVEPAPSVRRTPQAVSPARLGRLPRTGVDASALLFTAITGALLLLVGAISVAVTSRRR